jgi:general nucleoside transport system ATP-binding protein
MRLWHRTGPPAPEGPDGSAATAQLSVRGLTKRFGPVTACAGVSLDVAAGEIVGLLGQNGAGKTTLMNLVAGLQRPDSGSVTVGGVTLRPGHLAEARARGIAMVHQEFSLIDALTVWENVALVHGGRLSRHWTADGIRQLSEAFGLDMSAHLDTRAGTLSPAMRQRVEIVKCLVQEPRLILLDEPTAILSRQEASRLFEILRRLVRDRLASVVVSNHRLAEVLGSTDRIVVLRAGAVVADQRTADATERELAVQMLGDDLPRTRTDPDTAVIVGAAGSQGQGPAPAAGTVMAANDVEWAAQAPAPATPAAPASELARRGEPALRVTNLRARGASGAPALDGLSVQVAPGEIVGVVGVEGNGQAELMDVLGNRAWPSSGSVTVSGHEFRVARGQRLKGIGTIPADRHRHACVIDMSVAENLALGDLAAVSYGRFVSPRRMRRRAAALIEEYGINCTDPGVPLRYLSGGHQQRVILARELSRNPAVLVADQPTRGLDVAAVEDVWTRIRDAAGRGVGVLLNSSDLDEVLQLASRIVVVVRGRSAGEVRPDAVDAEALGLLMGGAGRDRAA